MRRYDLLYRLYDEFDAATLREYQDLVDLFPAVDSRVALDYWQDARDELERRKGLIREGLPDGDVYAEIAAHADRESAFAGLDLYREYGRSINALVLDVDETLRSAGATDNEIPRETLHVLTELHEQGLPLVICTGQTLENVKGFTIQGLGNGLVHSGSVSIVYEAGTGVFTPGHGQRTKQLLYEDLDDTVRGVFDEVRSRVLPEAPERIRRGCHLQGNEFNVTLKPNFEAATPEAVEVVADALVYLVDLLGTVVADHDEASAWARTYYADVDPEIRSVLNDRGALPSMSLDDVPDDVRSTFERVDVAYHPGDSAEIGSLELDKPHGVEAALDVLGIDDPFVFVMGDSTSDLRVMEWAAENDAGLAAAPEHASRAVLDHVEATDGLVFDRGDAATMLRTVYVMDYLTEL
jgi:hydroxymethylpyrimidine pyrophosphatase-like HAD family hydrolase